MKSLREQLAESHGREAKVFEIAHKRKGDSYSCGLLCATILAIPHDSTALDEIKA